MPDADAAIMRRRPRWGTLAVVVLLHIVALAGLVRVFAPDFAAEVTETAGSLISVTITAPREPPPEPEPDAAGEQGERATPREVAAPEAPLPRPSPAPRASSTGDANASGASELGQGTGAGGAGSGVGGGGGARPLELIAGRIDNARDYPTPPGGRRVRRGQDVVIELAVGTNGRVSGCRVTDPSPDPEADAITCRLATERFVFRPRLNADGEPVPGVFRWRQRWF